MVLLCAGVGAIVLYSGVYNVAATAPHSRLVAAILDAGQDASVEEHAKGLEPLASALEAKGRAGFVGYEKMCVGCHAAPGVERSDVGKGLYPPAPELWTKKYLTMSEVYWIETNGIKDTGMPAFGRTHEADELWQVASFVMRLGKMSAKDFDTLRKGGAG
jgi:mono/diheme cytochrome c family protein